MSEIRNRNRNESQYNPKSEKSTCLKFAGVFGKVVAFAISVRQLVRHVRRQARNRYIQLYIYHLLVYPYSYEIVMWGFVLECLILLVILECVIGI